LRLGHGHRPVQEQIRCEGEHRAGKAPVAVEDASLRIDGEVRLRAHRRDGDGALGEEGSIDGIAALKATIRTQQVDGPVRTDAMLRACSSQTWREPALHELAAGVGEGVEVVRGRVPLRPRIEHSARPIGERCVLAQEAGHDRRRVPPGTAGQIEARHDLAALARRPLSRDAVARELPARPASGEWLPPCASIVNPTGADPAPRRARGPGEPRDGQQPRPAPTHPALDGLPWSQAEPPRLVLGS
jgi:hypothetical protein